MVTDFHLVISESGKNSVLSTCQRSSYSAFISCCAGCSPCSLLCSYQALIGPQKDLYPKDLFTHTQSTDLDYGKVYSLSTVTGIVLGSMQ